MSSLCFVGSVTLFPFPSLPLIFPNLLLIFHDRAARLSGALSCFVTDHLLLLKEDLKHEPHTTDATVEALTWQTCRVLNVCRVLILLFAL